MKSRIKNKSLFTGLIMMFLMLFTVTGYSQACPGNKVTVTLQNITNPTTTTLEFDIYVSNTGSTSLQLAALQGAVIYNAGLLPDGATGTFTCITQPSQTGNFPNFNPLPSVTHTVLSRQLKWTSTPVTISSGNTVNLPSNTPMKFARFRFTSDVPWSTGFATTLTEQYAVRGGYTAVVATVYCNGNTSSTGLSSSAAGTLVCNDANNTPYSIILNPQVCATLASQTATSAVTCFGGSNGSSTITMSPLPTVTDITYSVDGGASQSATLSNGAFTITGLTAGTHTVVVSNRGCADVTATGVSVNGPSQLTNSTTATACDSYVWAVNGQTYTTSGTYSATTTSSNGCTVNETLNLTVNNSTTTQVTQVACNSYTWNGVTYTASGDYTYTSTNASGCTNVATLHLTINNSTTSEETQTSCGDYQWNGVTYTASGDYTYTSTNASGCNNVATLHLTINGNTITSQPASTSICKAIGGTASISVASSQDAVATYKWYSQAATATTWTLISNNANYSGATTSTLNITKSTLVLPLTGTKYKVEIISSCGITTSTVATLTDLITVSKATAVTVVGTLSPLLTTCAGTSVNLSLAAGSIGNIQWQSSTDGVWYSNVGDSVAQSALSALNTAMSFNTGALTQDTWFRVVATNGVCSAASSTPIKITVSQATSVGELTTAASTVCTATGTTLALGDSTGAVAWYKSTNFVNSTSAAAVWTLVPLSATVTSSALATGNLTYAAATPTTWYKAVVTNGACSSTSNVVSVTVSPAAVAKAITASPATICTGSSTTLTLATASVGSIQWQKSTTSSLEGFENVGDVIASTTATNGVVTLSTGALTQDTWFRIVFTSGACSVNSAVVKVTVSLASSVGDLTTAAATVCTATGTTLTLGTSTGTVAWYKSTNFVNATSAAAVWTLVPASATVTSTSLATGSLVYAAATPTTWYKAVVTSGACSSTSNVVSVTVSPAAKATAVSGNTGATTLATAVCSGTKTLTLATGYVGAIQWQYYNAGSSATAVTNTTVAATWTDIDGATGATLSAVSSAAGNVWFRVKLTSGPCTVAYGTPVNVWIKACGSSVRIEDAIEFKAIAYPNPFAENFRLDVKTSSEEALQIKVYDMLGKLVENRILEVSEIEGLEVGANYPSGVYNVIVSQGDVVKTLRVIKR